MSAYSQLTSIFKRVSYYQHALTLLHWDQEVKMPACGAGERGKAIAELSALVHQNLCDPQLETLLADALQEPLRSEESASLREIKRVWQDNNLMPENLVREQAIAHSRCQQAWNTLRHENDWNGFCESFEPVVELAREQAKIRQQALDTATPYDAMLSLYSQGDSAELVDRVFTQLKSELPGMIAAVCDKQRGLQKPQISGEFTLEQQRELSHKVMAFLGFDFNAGRLDVSAHPFSTGNPGDQRITTRYNTEEFIEALYATVHETGHSRYEAGLPVEWRGLPVGQARNMGVHESQSLFYEKHIGNSPAFCDFVVSHANQLFKLGTPLSGGDLRRAVTWVEPGYIRVIADELTYPLHVILRFEIEKGLINGEMDVADIPTAWNEKMQCYLGLSTENNYKNGCMQDVHWPSGAFGYFPSYTLGAVNAAQVRVALEAQLGSINSIVESGDITPIATWLNDNIWQHACFLESQELIEKATGKPTSADSLLSHFKVQYGL